MMHIHTLQRMITRHPSVLSFGSGWIGPEVEDTSW